MKILNLTQHKATDPQIEAGLINLNEEEHEKLKGLLTFVDLPSQEEMEERVSQIRTLAINAAENRNLDTREIGVMIGGAPWLMSTLERALYWSSSGDLLFGEVVYAFSKREVIESVTPGGEVIKNSVFRHKGFILVKKP